MKQGSCNFFLPIKFPVDFQLNKQNNNNNKAAVIQKAARLNGSEQAKFTCKFLGCYEGLLSANEKNVLRFVMDKMRSKTE